MRPVRAALSLVALAGTLILVPAPASTAELPTVRLTHTGETATALRWPGEGMVISFGSYVESVGGRFELHARADGTVSQIVRNADGTLTEVRRIRWATRHLDAGLNAFFVLEARDAAGAVVGRTRLPFCPASRELARIDDSGPDQPTMPPACFATPITQATVWGIDAGWAMAAPVAYDLGLDLADGTYDVTLSVSNRWVRALAIPDGASKVHFPLQVSTIDFDDLEGIFEKDSAKGVAGGVPDLVSLPAWLVETHRDDATGKDLVVFAASVWNAGTGPLVVEGFRRPGASTMDAYQYFYADGRSVSRTRAGTLVFHEGDGHDHWHFIDFARYALLDRATGQVVRSEKEAFCLAPTDPVDLTLPDAVWDPGETGLHSACGSPESIWIREVLPVGWGDTYYQTLPGQSFDVTTLPNGRYAIEVTANPDGTLADLDPDNDVALREIRLGGTPGSRTVEVLTEFP